MDSTATPPTNTGIVVSQVSAQRVRSRSQKILIGALIGIGLVCSAATIFFMVALYWIFYAPSSPFAQFEKVTSQVSKSYSTVPYPSSWELANSTEAGDPIDIALEYAGWDYTYESPDGAEANRASFSRALTEHTFRVASTDQPNQIMASSEAKNLKLSITFEDHTVTVRATELRVDE